MSDNRLKSPSFDGKEKPTDVLESPTNPAFDWTLFWQRFMVAMLVQVFAWLPMFFFCSGVWLFLILYFPFIFVLSSTTNWMEPGVLEFVVAFVFPVIVGGISYSALAAAIMTMIHPEKDSPQKRLLQIFEATKAVDVSNCSEDGFYANATDDELVDVYHLIDRENNPSRFATLIMEVRRRLDIHVDT